MLARRAAVPLAPRFPCRAVIWRALHASSSLWNNSTDVSGKNHYDRLGLRHDASNKDVKKSFYALSKTFHPDVNRTDPNAARTFALLSESYTILSDPARRAAYDRDVLRLHQQEGAYASAVPRGSYHSAGGRPPSGLSKRRSTFRGPPPSFYRSGGWGAHSEKRRQAHEESTSSWWQHREAHREKQHEQQQYGGMGPGSNPFGAQRSDDNVSHFDRDGHTRTHTREDQRRSQRQRSRRALGDDDVEFEPQTSLAGHFFIVTAILAATFVAPLVYLQFMRVDRRHRKDKGS